MTNTNVKSYYTNLYIPISTCRNPGYKQVDTLVFSADSSDLVKADVISVDQWNTATDEEVPKSGEEEKRTDTGGEKCPPLCQRLYLP